MATTAIRNKWVCQVCGYIYGSATGDSKGGISQGTVYDDLPDTWCCPDCGAGKSQFDAMEDN